MKNLTKALAMIIGGSSGMGLATAKQLLKQDIDVIIIGSSAEKLAAAKQDLANIAPVETLQADLYQASDVQHLIDFISNNRHINYLVNAAGKFKPTAFLDHDVADYNNYLDLNRATFFISQAVAKNIAAHVADADNTEQIFLYVDVDFAKVTFDGFPGPARRNAHFLVVVPGRSA